MLPKNPAMFTICVFLIFAAVKSQEQLINPVYVTSFQSDSSSGFAPPSITSSYSISSSSSESSSTNNLQYSPEAPDPDVELFAHTLSRLLQASEVLKDFSTFAVNKPYNYFYNIGVQILQRDAIYDTYLADLAGDAGNTVGIVDSHLYFDSMAHMFAKFFAVAGLMSKDVALTYPQQILTFVEEYAKQNGLIDTESLMSSVSNGFYNFADSLGLVSPENLATVITLFSQDIQDLAKKTEL